MRGRHRPCVSTASSKANAWGRKVSELSSVWALRCSSEQDSWWYEKILDFSFTDWESPRCHRSHCHCSVTWGGSLWVAPLLWGEHQSLRWRFFSYVAFHKTSLWLEAAVLLQQLWRLRGKGHDVLSVWREAGEELPLELRPMLVKKQLLNYFA